MSYTAEQAAELAKKLEYARILIGASNDNRPAAIVASNINEAWHIVTDVKAALEQQAKEASEVVAWMYVNDDGECEEIGPIDRYDGEVPECSTPLYKAPPQPESVKTALRKAADICKNKGYTDIRNIRQELADEILAIIDKENAE